MNTETEKTCVDWWHDLDCRREATIAFCIKLFEFVSDDPHDWLDMVEMIEKRICRR
jgi:hypothetical protein